MVGWASCSGGAPGAEGWGSLYPFPLTPAPDRLRSCCSLGRVWYPLQRDPGKRSRFAAWPGPSAASESPLSGRSCRMRPMSRADRNHEGWLRGRNSARPAGPSVPWPVLGPVRGRPAWTLLAPQVLGFTYRRDQAGGGSELVGDQLESGGALPDPKVGRGSGGGVGFRPGIP